MFRLFPGPTCGTLDLLPAPRRGAWPYHRPNASSPETEPRVYEPVSWGFTAVRDVGTGKYHGFVDTGCYNTDPHEQFSHMAGYQTTHVVGDSALGPFTGTAIAAPPTHFNPHAFHFDDGSSTGLYVLYTNGGMLRAQDPGASQQNHESRRRDCNACCKQCCSPLSCTGCCPGCPPCASPGGTCNGMEENHTHQPLPFDMPAGNCTTTLCALFATSPSGPWKIRSVDSGCTDNAVPYQLKNGSILCVYTAPLSCAIVLCTCMVRLHTIGNL